MGFSRRTLVVVCITLTTVTSGAPSYPDGNNQLSPSSPSSNRITLQSIMNRNKGQAGELDVQTKNDLRILSLFEHELNKIFSCYIRLSCPRTRSPEVVSECEMIRDWPLYHQVMKMAGVHRYPYQNYAPRHPPVTIRTEVETISIDNDLEDAETTPLTVSTSIRPRGRRQRRRRNHLLENTNAE